MTTHTAARRQMQISANGICSEALIIFGIHEYTAVLVKFEYFMVISLDRWIAGSLDRWFHQTFENIKCQKTKLFAAV
jgi:hypothetical protein